MELLLQNKPKRLSIKDEINIRLSKRRKHNHSRKLEYNMGFQKYLRDIEEITGRPLHPQQRKFVREAIEKNDYYKLTPKKSHEHRREYSKKRKELIAEWEKNTGQEWPKYDEPVYSRSGEVVRMAGVTYDAHHIILCSWNGPNQWWNFVPLAFPKEHQEGVHRKGGHCEQIFK